MSLRKSFHIGSPSTVFDQIMWAGTTDSNNLSQVFHSVVQYGHLTLLETTHFVSAGICKLTAADQDTE
ncbi:hypothetical protein WG66_001837 [Moniliophthora roreri]|nr:hypothetical protein WG66_001837 [Moniliophthora roreri]